MWEIIPASSFLYRVPAGLHAKQRFALEGLAVSITAISLAYQRLVEVAMFYPEQTITQITHLDRIGMFNDAWSIVDHTHTIRCLMRVFENTSIWPKFENFVGGYENARELRNRMDHLPQILDNLANRASPTAPLYGALKFKIAHRFENGSLSRWLVASIAAGSASQQPTWQIADTQEFTLEHTIGDFRLEAFDLHFNLSSLYRDLKSLVPVFEELGEQIVAKLRTRCSELGISADTQIEPQPNIVLVAELGSADAT